LDHPHGEPVHEDDENQNPPTEEEVRHWQDLPEALKALERGERGEGHTRSVKFPVEFDQHLGHGDADGPCPGHRE
jgi:hypothetical protein